MFRAIHRKAAEPRDSPSVGFVSPGYFTTMGIPLLLGRDIDDRDILSARDVMVVNETFAKHFFAERIPSAGGWGRRRVCTNGRLSAS